MSNATIKTARNSIAGSAEAKTCVPLIAMPTAKSGSAETVAMSNLSESPTMTTTKTSALLAMAAVMGLGAQMSLPSPRMLDELTWKPGNKGRSNNKPDARAKDRARTKAAHKSRPLTPKHGA